MTPHEENELICEKLLGWRMVCRSPDDHSAVWNSTYASQRTPSFTTWAEAGLILEALQAANASPLLSWNRQVGEWELSFQRIGELESMRLATTGPLAIRAAALSYLETLK